MHDKQIRLIEQLADRLGLGQGDVMRIANEIAGHELSTLYALDRAEGDRLIVYLDSLALVGTR